MSWRVDGLLTGTPKSFRDEEKSAIGKRPVAGPVNITTLGLIGDEQADPKHHGGPHMAVHQYPLDHHAFWRGEIGDHALLSDPGAFGSNLAVQGLTEAHVRIGNRYRMGTALLEVSQPRQPCWKIEHRFAQKGMVARILKTGRCGWYYRVIEEGVAEAGDMLEQVSRASSDWSVARVFSLLWGDPKAANPDELRALASLDTLTPKLRDKAAQRVK